MKFKYILGIVLMIFLFTTMSAQNESGVFGYNSFELKGNFTYYNNYTINEFDFNESDLNVNSSDYWDEYDVVSDILFSDLTWNFGDDWNYISGDQFYFNDSKLSTKYYEPSSLEELEGTGIGTLSDIQTLEDGNIYTIEESNQAPGFDFRVNFTNINEFNQLYLRTSTNDNQDETISIQLYNYDTGSWNTQNSFTYLDDFQVFDIGIFNGQYIQDGTVQMRLYHSDKGKNNEEVYIDWISLAKGYGTPASEDLFYLQELLIDSTNINDTIKITDGNGNNISEVTINDNYEPDTNCSGDSSCSLITYDSETTGWDKDASDDLTTSTSFSGDISGTYNSLDIDSSVVSDREVSSLSWDELNNYPSACPEDTYLTQLGDSVTCTGIDDNWVDESGDTMTGGLGIGYSQPSGTDLHVDGNVGIGTTNPTEELTILGDDTNSKMELLVTGTSGDSQIHFGDGNDVNAGRIAYAHSNDLMSFYTGGTADQMVIDNGGNVGIGTTNPSSILNVWDGASGETGGWDSNSSVRIEDDSTSYIEFETPNTGTYAGMMFSDNTPQAGGIEYGHSGTSHVNTLGLGAWDGISFRVSGTSGVFDKTERMHLDNSGNLDVDGNLNVGGTLDVNGDFKFSGEGKSDIQFDYTSIAEEPFYFGYLSTTQTNVEGGTYVNVWENTDGVFTTSDMFDVSNSELSISKGGYYKFDYNVQVHRTGSDGRGIMESYLEVNGNPKQDQSATSCYIRDSVNGDECTMTGTSVLNLNGDDSVKLYVHEKRGGETGNDVEHARIKISRIR